MIEGYTDGVKLQQGGNVTIETENLMIQAINITEKDLEDIDTYSISVNKLHHQVTQKHN